MEQQWDARSMVAGEAGVVLPAPDELDREVQLRLRYFEMLKAIQSWGVSLIVLGALSIIASGFLDPIWGILLIVVGLGSFLVRDAAMFAVYGVTLAWAAVLNALGGLGSESWGWVGFSLLQVYLAVRVFGNYVGFRQVQREIEALDDGLGDTGTGARRAERLFPAGAFVCGLVASLTFMGLIASAIVIIGVQEAEPDPAATEYLVSATMDVAVLGIALGLGSVLSGFKRRGLAVLGLLAGGAVLLDFLVLLVAANLAG
jgi:hypothetical protein